MVHQRGGTLTPPALRRRAVLGTAALAIGLIAAQTVGPARAATTTTTSVFIPGGAAATSQAFALSPRNAGLAATITIGRSIANYRNDLSQASSQAVDLGLIGSTLTVQCSSLPATLKPNQLPQPLVAESDRGTSESTQGDATSIAAAGREFVSAHPAPHPRATATFDGGKVGIPGVFTISGLSSSSYAELIPDKARIAVATADLGSLNLAGQVQLKNLHWEASVRSGTKPSRSASFTVGSMKIAGTSIPVPDLPGGSTLDSINKALSSTGLHINLPTLSDEHGIIAITPLSIGIANSALGAKLLNPVISTVFGQILGGIVDSAAKAVCTIGSGYGLVNLFIAAIDGVGAFDVELGGATATSDHKTYANPFGDGETPPALGGSSPPPAAGGSDIGGGSVDTPPLPDASGTAAPVQNPQVAGREVASSCSTTSPAGRPSCSRGAGLAVALIALATLGGVAGADYVVVRRRRRLARMAITS